MLIISRISAGPKGLGTKGTCFEMKTSDGIIKIHVLGSRTIVRCSKCKRERELKDVEVKLGIDAPKTVSITRDNAINKQPPSDEQEPEKPAEE